MSKQLIIILICAILAIFFAGWGMSIVTHKYKNKSQINQAIPVIRFERFNEKRNALIIGLFNPGTLPMEINRTELSYQNGEGLPRVVFSRQEYSEKPLVLDPDDTILVPLRNKRANKVLVERDSYWGELYFQIPGQADFFSLHHRFSQKLLNEIRNFLKTTN